MGRWRTLVICFGTVIDGVGGLMLGVLESDTVEESLLGLADLFADFYIVS